MQTFLPYRDFRDSLNTLDPKRLGNQIYRETLTLLRGGWSNHPASKMWKGHFGCLASYGLIGLEVLRERGKPYPYWEKVFAFYRNQFASESSDPSWLGDERLHSAHRAALLAKNYEWYSRFGWKEEPKIEYWWPV